jgi:hypothetical protein
MPGVQGIGWNTTGADDERSGLLLTGKVFLDILPQDADALLFRYGQIGVY